MENIVNNNASFLFPLPMPHCFKIHCLHGLLTFDHYDFLLLHLSNIFWRSSVSVS